MSHQVTCVSDWGFTEGRLSYPRHSELYLSHWTFGVDQGSGTFGSPATLDHHSRYPGRRRLEPHRGLGHPDEVPPSAADQDEAGAGIPSSRQTTELRLRRFGEVSLRSRDQRLD
jgi:hypothetical protein